MTPSGMVCMNCGAPAPLEGPCRDHNAAFLADQSKHGNDFFGVDRTAVPERFIRDPHPTLWGRMLFKLGAMLEGWGFYLQNKS